MLERHPKKPQQVLRQLSRIRLAPEDDQAVQEEYLDLIASHRYRMSMKETTRGESFNICHLEKYCLWYGNDGFRTDFWSWRFDALWGLDFSGT
jgi:hypothetical protein